MKRYLNAFISVFVLTASIAGGLVETAGATPNLRIVTWDASRGRDDMILTDTMEGQNIEYLYNDLVKPAYFGPSGVVRCTPNIRYVSAIATGSLISGGVRQADVFFGNQIDPNDPVIPLSAEEAAELASFINAGGVAYISGHTNGQGDVWNGLFTALGISDHFNSDSHCSGSISLPLVTTPFTNGPFGTVGSMGWPCFGSIETSTLIPVIKAGGTPPSYVLIAEGVFGAGRLTVSGGVIAHDSVSGNASTRRYLLNMFAHGCNAPKLQVYQTIVPEVVTPGQPVTIILEVTNLSEGAINSVVISDVLPAIFTNPSYTSSGLILSQQSGSLYTWQAGTLAGQASGTITISATVAASATAATTITNLATISGTDGVNPVSDSSSVTISAQECYATADDGVTVHRTLQAAIDAAPDGSTVKVAGYCADVTTVNNDSQTAYINKNLTICGGFSGSGWSYDPEAYPTTIDPRQKGRVITMGAVKVTLRDLNLINGRVMGYGGGINAPSNSLITLNNVKLANNTSVKNIGGGLFTYGALTAENSRFIGNWAYRAGGGALTEGTTTITDCLFQDNVAPELDGGGLNSFKTLNLSGTRFINNRSGQRGGGLYIEGLEAGQNRIENTLFSGNTAGVNGAAIALFRYGVSGASAQIIHATISGSSGTVSAIDAPLYPVNVTNSIIDGYAVGIETSTSSLAAASEDYNLFNVNSMFGASGTVTGGTHSLTGSPKFVDATSGDYHILPGSPAIDHAANLGVTTDLDGNPRPSGVAPDMGAYEVQQLQPVRIAGTAKYYSTLKGAQDDASDGNTLEAREQLFPEILQVSKVLTLKGGFDSVYETRTGFTLVQGLDILTGSLLVDSVAVQ